jgi:hypothetical protein
VADLPFTDSESAEIQTESLSEKLGIIIEKLPPTGVTLHDLMHLVGQDGLMILTALLSLVFIIPVSIPGVSTVFGAAILLISTSRLFRCNPWLPKSLQSRVISTEKLLPVFQKSLRWLHRLERVVRPHRLGWLTSGGLIGIFNNCSLILGAVLLMAPFGLIPFSNTLPAVAILCLSVGIVLRDGVCILLGYLGNLSSIIYFGALIGGGGLAIREALLHFSS